MNPISYTKTIWIDEETMLDEDNLNNIEEGIEQATDAINEIIEEGGGLIDKIQISGSDLPIVEKVVNIPLADATQNGAMAKESITAIQTLTTDVATLKGQNIRLSYTAGPSPTAAEIQTFVQSQGYTDPTKWASISVVVKDTNHIWRCTSSGSGEQIVYTWADIGLDTINPFTNVLPGIIKGSALDGKVYAEDDGTGSVYGWDTLKGRVTTLENNAVTLSANNTFTGNNTFTTGINYPGLYYNYKQYNNGSQFINKIDGTNNGTMLTDSYFAPLLNNSKDLGESGTKWKDIYLAGSLKDGTNSFSIEQINAGLINVINANDIVNNTFTDAQMALVTNGKPTQIIGTLLSYNNPLLMTIKLAYGNTYFGVLQGIGYFDYANTYDLVMFRINNNQIAIGGLIGRNDVRLSFDLNNHSVSISGRQGFSFQGKSFPSYPSSPSNNKVLTYTTGNALAWGDKTSTVTDTTSTTISRGLYSNTTYQYTQPITSIAIASFDVQTYDENPVWELQFVAGSGLSAITFPSGKTIKWVGGTAPTFVANQEYKLRIVKDVAADTFVVKDEFSAGGETQKYLHTVSWYHTDYDENYFITFISTRVGAYTMTDFNKFLATNAAKGALFERHLYNAGNPASNSPIIDITGSATGFVGAITDANNMTRYASTYTADFSDTVIMI